jgi:hypothetical protein
MPITPSIAFPGYVPDVNDGDPVTAGHDDAVRDRAFQVFATAALRDAAIVSPQVGQVCHITTGTTPFTGVLAPGFYTYVGGTDKWQPLSWNAPWGLVAPEVVITTPQAGITAVADITSATATFTAIANRLYRIKLKGSVLQSTNAADITVSICNAANTALTSWPQHALATTWLGYNLETPLQTPVAGSITYKGRLASSAASASTGAAVTQPTTFSVEDCGPAGAPS